MHDHRELQRDLVRASRDPENALANEIRALNTQSEVLCREAYVPGLKSKLHWIDDKLDACVRKAHAENNLEAQLAFERIEVLI